MVYLYPGRRHVGLDVVYAVDDLVIVSEHRMQKPLTYVRNTLTRDSPTTLLLHMIRISYHQLIISNRNLLDLIEIEIPCIEQSLVIEEVAARLVKRLAVLVTVGTLRRQTVDALQDSVRKDEAHLDFLESPVGTRI